ncbi:hypothetical protein A6V37_38240 [Paraburkholderia ginsengiterrae]|uniref:Uncharacterized protein n=1 Tax=Paraburkholderia ginsengiterrae TaxID=1462993 RepID=A0A1A9N8L7_9BURK|nr:hypothetical protein A6V37_38240 [Paraburkholderia ginsengiterrae]
MLPPAQLVDWCGRFLPDLGAKKPATRFEPVTVTDRTDGKIAHLDGLNLSRAWCQRALAPCAAEIQAVEMRDLAVGAIRHGDRLEPRGGLFRAEIRQKAPAPVDQLRGRQHPPHQLRLH